MPVSKPLPRHLRAAREKIYGAARGSPLDRNAKSRIMAYADGYNAMHRQKGQHWGPLTRACLQVLEASPDLGAPDQGLRLVGGGKPATLQQASSRVLENPAIANYRFWALKVSPGRNITAS